MVAQQTLTLFVKVRVLTPQLLFLPSNSVAFRSAKVAFFRSAKSDDGPIDGQTVLRRIRENSRMLKHQCTNKLVEPYQPLRVSIRFQLTVS